MNKQIQEKMTDCSKCQAEDEQDALTKNNGTEQCYLEIM